MTWERALAHARRRAAETGRRWYVRGYQRTITHIGEWLYGAYDEPYPNLNAANRRRPEHWGSAR